MKTQHRSAAHAKRRYQADPFAIFKVVARTTGFNEAERIQCTNPIDIAWECLRSGTADANNIEALTDMIAICIVASEFMDPLILETVDAGRLAMIGIADRYTRCKRWGVDAAALRDIPPVIHFYTELVRNATGGQFEEWLLEVRGGKARVHAA